MDHILGLIRGVSMYSDIMCEKIKYLESTGGLANVIKNDRSHIINAAMIMIKIAEQDGYNYSTSKLIKTFITKYNDPQSDLLVTIITNVDMSVLMKKIILHGFKRNVKIMLHSLLLYYSRMDYVAFDSADLEVRCAISHIHDDFDAHEEPVEYSVVELMAERLEQTPRPKMILISEFGTLLERCNDYHELVNYLLKRVIYCHSMSNLPEREIKNLVKNFKLQENFTEAIMDCIQRTFDIVKDADFSFIGTKYMKLFDYMYRKDELVVHYEKTMYHTLVYRGIIHTESCCIPYDLDQRISQSDNCITYIVDDKCDFCRDLNKYVATCRLLINTRDMRYQYSYSEFLQDLNKLIKKAPSLQSGVHSDTCRTETFEDMRNWYNRVLDLAKILNGLYPPIMIDIECDTL